MIFDVYGVALPCPIRMLETACTIDGAGFSGANRGGRFARFGNWLTQQRADLTVDDRYRQLGKSDQRAEATEAGAVLQNRPAHSREVLGTETLYSGQGFDRFSVLTWTIWRLTQAGTTSSR